jgi:hypothetical protein
MTIGCPSLETARCALGAPRFKPWCGWANKAGLGIGQLLGAPAIELCQSAQVAAGAQCKQDSQKPSYGCL